jgi:hypothetical protein
MRAETIEKFRVQIIGQEKRIESLAAQFGSLQEETEIVSSPDACAKKDHKEPESEITQDCSTMLEWLEHATYLLPEDQLTQIAQQVESFLIQVAKRMDPFSIDRMLVVGDAYRASELIGTRELSGAS